MNFIEYLVFVSYILSLITLSFIPHFLYTGKALEDQTQAQTESETESETEEETQEEETQEEEIQEEETQEEDYTQTENITLRRRTVVFNEKDGTTTIITEYV
jgi:hypothetical protein